MSEWTNERMKERKNEWMNEWMIEGMSEWKNEWMKEWMDERMNEQKNEHTAEWKSTLKSHWPTIIGPLVSFSGPCLNGELI